LPYFRTAFKFDHALVDALDQWRPTSVLEPEVQPVNQGVNFNNGVPHTKTPERLFSFGLPQTGRMSRDKLKSLTRHHPLNYSKCVSGVWLLFPIHRELRQTVIAYEHLDTEGGNQLIRGYEIIGHDHKFPRHWVKIPFRFWNRVSPTFSSGRYILVGRIENDIQPGFRAFLRC
jgi:hypothetical protein